MFDIGSQIRGNKRACGGLPGASIRNNYQQVVLLKWWWKDVGPVIEPPVGKATTLIDVERVFEGRANGGLMAPHLRVFVDNVLFPRLPAAPDGASFPIRAPKCVWHRQFLPCDATIADAVDIPQRAEPALQALGGDERREVGDAVAVAPLVVVPAEDLHHVAFHDHGGE